MTITKISKQLNTTDFPNLQISSVINLLQRKIWKGLFSKYQNKSYVPVSDAVVEILVWKKGWCGQRQNYLSTNHSNIFWLKCWSNTKLLNTNLMKVCTNVRVYRFHERRCSLLPLNSIAGIVPSPSSSHLIFRIEPTQWNRRECSAPDAFFTLTLLQKGNDKSRIFLLQLDRDVVA